MEVCGGHTMAIHRFGLKTLSFLPTFILSQVRVVRSVFQARNFIDKALAYSSRIPGSNHNYIR
jgi:hydrogenase maturation factor